jgi:hypothetical protein
MRRILCKLFKLVPKEQYEIQKSLASEWHEMFKEGKTRETHQYNRAQKFYMRIVRAAKYLNSEPRISRVKVLDILDGKEDGRFDK